MPSASLFWGTWTWTSRPEGESARFVVVFASIDGLKSIWPQPPIAGASKTAAEVTWSGCCQVVASIVVASGPLQAVGFESRGAERGRFGVGARGGRSAAGEPERVVAGIPGHSPDAHRRGEDPERRAEAGDRGRQPIVAAAADVEVDAGVAEQEPVGELRRVSPAGATMLKIGIVPTVCPSARLTFATPTWVVAGQLPPLKASWLH